MDHNEIISVTSHQIQILERKNIKLTGIKKIISFDHEEFLMESVMGILHIKGEDLEVIKLDTQDGNVAIKGTVHGINYLNDKSKKKEESFIAKLFK